MLSGAERDAIRKAIDRRLRLNLLETQQRNRAHDLLVCELRRRPRPLATILRLSAKRGIDETLLRSVAATLGVREGRADEDAPLVWTLLERQEAPE